MSADLKIFLKHFIPTYVVLQADAEKKEIQHLGVFASRHMINDCSPQHFTLAHFTDGLGDKKASSLCVRGGGG